MTRWMLLVGMGLASVLLLSGLHSFSPRPGGDAQAAPVPVTNPFKGKTIVVLARDKVAHTLVQVQVKQLGGRTFLVGQVVKDSPHKITREPYGEVKVWIPVDGIMEIVELKPLKAKK